MPLIYLDGLQSLDSQKTYAEASVCCFMLSRLYRRLQVEEISWSDDWKGDVCKLLKRRGFKEAEEGANELSHQKRLDHILF